MRGSAALLAACTAALGVLLLSVVDEASFAPQHHVITAIAPHEPPRNAYECAVSHLGAVRDIACEFWIVVTGADSPRTVALFKTALARQWCAVFVETPGAPGPQWRAAQHAKTTSGIFHLPLDAQLALPFASANVTGGMRKNLGYLFALQRGAKAVFDFDASVEHELLASGQDLANWAVRLTCNATSYFRDPVVRGRMARMHTWCPRHVFVNPLPDLGPRAWANASAVFAWPFGFPRHLREDANTFVECAFAGGDDADDDQVQADRTGVVHFPVVVRDHVYFAPRPKHFAGVALPAGTLSLFDSRSTLFLAPAFFGLALLPAGASSDALRSLVVSRVLWDTGVHVAHAHPLSARLPRGRDDNDDNVAVSRELVDAIAAWRPSEEQPVPWRMLDLLVALQRRGLASAQQLGAMRAWLCDLQALNVSFPALRSGGGAVGSRPQPQAASEPLYFARERDRLLNASFAASILVRMYGGDRKFHYYWQRLSELFVDRDSLDVVIVLDEDAPGDYEFAAKYFQRHGTRCTFEPLPANASQVFTSPFARLGYQRQIYSTLFCDNHTFSDAVGVVDSDLMPFGLLSAGSMFCSSDGASEDWKRRKLKLYGEISASHWPADSVMLNTSGNVDFMYQGVFPYWYWRTTFPRARAHMSRVHDNASVEELWARYTKLFVPVPTHPTANSNFGLLGNFAVAHEPDRYCLVLGDNYRQGRASALARTWRRDGVLCETASCFVARAGHKTGGALAPNAGTVRLGCAVTFGVRDCAWFASNGTLMWTMDLLWSQLNRTDLNDAERRAFHLYASAVTSQLDRTMPRVREIIGSYVADVQPELASMRQRTKNEMAQACAALCRAPADTWSALPDAYREPGFGL